MAWANTACCAVLTAAAGVWPEALAVACDDDTPIAEAAVATALFAAVCVVVLASAIADVADPAAWPAVWPAAWACAVWVPLDGVLAPAVVPACSAFNVWISAARVGFEAVTCVVPAD